MCFDALKEDFSRSRIRWYDLPALLFFHRPVRCRVCDERRYRLIFNRKQTVLPSLWMHYILLIALIGGGSYLVQERSSTSPVTNTVHKPVFPEVRKPTNDSL